MWWGLGHTSHTSVELHWGHGTGWRMGTEVGSPTAVVTQARRGGDMGQVGGGPSEVRGGT